MTPAQILRAAELVDRRDDIKAMMPALTSYKTIELRASGGLLTTTDAVLDLDPIAVSDLLDRELERVTRELTELGVDLREPAP